MMLLQNKVAIVSGISGQDGAYLAKLLISKNYFVVGLVRSCTNSNLSGLGYLGIINEVKIEECDLTDMSLVIKLLKKYKPVEFYNLAAQSSVSQSFKQPLGTFQFNTISVYNILEAILLVDKSIKFYQASTSEMYGRVEQLPIKLDAAFYPMSPYAISKAAAHWACVNYRESYNMFVCCGILFNHESYLRSDNFFVKKVISQALKLKSGQLSKLVLGNLDVKRDFGFAPKYVEAMYLMMQYNLPEDFIICSGKSISLRSIVEHIFLKLNLALTHIEISEDLFRPAEILDNFGDPNKAKSLLGWEYNLDFLEVLDKIIEEEIVALQR